MRIALHQIYVSIYVEYVVKNPLSPVEHPGGLGVNNELFAITLAQFVVRFTRSIRLCSAGFAILIAHTIVGSSVERSVLTHTSLPLENLLPPPPHRSDASKLRRFCPTHLSGRMDFYPLSTKPANPSDMALSA